MFIPRPLTVFSIFLGASLAIAPCIAEPAAPPALQTVRQSPGYRNAVQTVVQQYEASLRTHCATAQLEWDKAQVHLYPPTNLDEKGQLVNATWHETVPGSACGHHRRYNTITLIRDGKPSVLPLFPGESNAGPTLQQDSVTYVGSAIVARGVSSDCHVDILETQLPNGRPANDQTPWNERWRVDACGKQFFVTLHYIPDATGTTINVSPKETVPAS